MKLGLSVAVSSVPMIVIGISGLVNLKKGTDALETVYNDRVVCLQRLKVVADMYAVKSGDALREILDQINTVTEQVSQIATTAEEQNATTSEISSNIHRITEVVQITASGSQESVTAASQLSRFTEGLEKLVGHFVLYCLKPA